MNTGYPSIDRTHLQGIPEEKLHPKIYPMSLLTTFLKINEEHLDEVAIEANGEKYTKEVVRQDSIDVARLLLFIGLVAGDTIAIMTTNCYEGIITIIGANAIGIKVVMLEPQNDKLLAKELETHRPKFVLTKGRSVGWISRYITSYDFVKRCLDVDSLEPLYRFSYALTTANMPINLVMTEVKKYGLTDDEPMIFLKTSGSTSGNPKTLPFSNRAVFASLIYASNSTGTKTRDESVSRVLCNAPYQHGYGWMTMFVNLIGGNQVVLVGGTKEDIAMYYRLRPSYIYGTPLTLKQFMELTPDDANLSSLSAFFCAGASISEKEYQDGIAWFSKHHSNCEIRNNYGISEGLCIGTASDGIPHLPGTSGKFYVGPEWLLVDEDLNEVKYGEVGEAIVAAESLCQGYFQDPEATKEAFIKKDGKTFFRSGDYMSLSEDGYVHFVGRKRRFFFAEGVTDKVNCETIEQALSSLASVETAAVIIKKDASGVESAKAFVSLERKRNPQNAEAEIRTALANLLQPYQMPKEIEILDEIPLMRSGKIDYKSLENMR